MKFIKKINKWLAIPVLWLIWIYQRVLSPDHGLPRGLFPYGFCRFYPTCSSYAYQALYMHGLFPGLVYSLLRLIKCHPWKKPAVDPVPIHPV